VAQTNARTQLLASRVHYPKRLYVGGVGVGVVGGCGGVGAGLLGWCWWVVLVGGVGAGLLFKQLSTANFRYIRR